LTDHPPDSFELSGPTDTFESDGADRWGVPVQAANAGARACFDAAVEDLVSLAGAPGDRAAEAAAADPTLVMAPIFLAYLDLYATTNEANTAAAARLAPLAALETNLPERERLHLRAARAWAAGDLVDATRWWERALLTHPRDLLALKVAQDVYFFLGDQTNLRDVVERVLPSWPGGTTGWGWVQGMAAFGEEESGAYPLAERRVGSALEVNPADVWAVHAGAHVFEMQGLRAEGVAFLSATRPDWEASYFAVHNWWHHGLFLVEAGDLVGAIDLYDRRIRPKRFETWLDVVDAASLLWRLALYGIDVGPRAGELAALCEPQLAETVYVFNDLHMAMAFALAGRRDLGEALVEANRSGPWGTNAAVVGQVGGHLLRAFSDFGAGHYGAAAAILYDHRRAARAIGGSHAQRDVIDLTVLAAAVAAGDRPMTRALRAERRARKPGAEAAADLLVDASVRRREGDRGGRSTRPPAATGR
jgi:tetratricopeptide (TPR) repeat protein